MSNEARFVFTVQSIVMPQKLKGTLTFIVKVSRKMQKNKVAAENTKQKQNELVIYFGVNGFCL